MGAGWFVAGVALFGFLFLTYSLNLRIGRQQKAQANNRPLVGVERFADVLGESGITRPIATAVHKELSVYCSRSIDLHPRDSIRDFLMMDGDELDFVAGRLLKVLSLQLPPIEVSREWQIETPLDLALLLQHWRDRQAAQEGELKPGRDPDIHA